MSTVDYAAAARAAKVSQLSDLLSDALSIAGAKDPSEVATAAEFVTDDELCGFAELARIRRPSATTCAAVRRALRIRAEQAAVPNPFAGSW